MREKRDRSGRTIQDLAGKIKKKYLLVFEGAETEEIYFDAFKEYNQNLLVDIAMLIRSNSEQGFSNPEKMLKMILENVKERKEDKYSYHTLIDWIVDYLKEKQLIYLKACDIKKKLENICQSEIENNLCETVDETKTEKVIELLLTKLKEQVKCEFKEISKELIEDLIKDNEIDYRAEIDEIVMIVDRDKKSFTEKQYDDVCDSCKDNGIKLVVTNPCFEFWLLLHFDVNSEEDFEMEKMLENPKDGNSNYCFSILRNVFKKNNLHYKKNKFDVKYLMSKVDDAIENEKQYCEDVIDLKNNIGSNIGKLITELRNTT